MVGPASPTGGARGCFHDRRDRVDPFVSRHFTWPGTLRLHGAALGVDILRAPINVALSPLLVLALILRWVLRRLGMRRQADWLAQRRIHLPTAVARRIEVLIVTELLGLAATESARLGDEAALSRAVLSAPQLRELVRRSGSVEAAQVMSRRILRALGDYSGTRAAVAEMTAALFTLAVGAAVFQALTPGVMSMAPGVAEAVSHGTAVAEFPLGESLGGVWYGVFPVGPAPWLVAATIVVLVMAGAVVAAFAGILADPVQAWLGIHRRRLMRLIDTLEAEASGSADRPFATREHFYARAFDLWDAAVSLARVFRG
ncbi:MAG: hypothetical protein KF887_03270 [Paracoccaceae bacterium]|nr:MAG: hypothetical protein KF887_03270 [Paracoccaceae bacterium]